MSRRKPELQALDIASWPSVAWTDLDTKAREVIKLRMQAIERFAQGEPVKAIEEPTGIDRRQLYRWLERGLSPHPDGRIFGFRGMDLPTTVGIDLEKDAFSFLAEKNVKFRVKSTGANPR